MWLSSHLSFRFGYKWQKILYAVKSPSANQNIKKCPEHCDNLLPSFVYSCNVRKTPFILIKCHISEIQFLDDLFILAFAIRMPGGMKDLCAQAYGCWNTHRPRHIWLTLALVLKNTTMLLRCGICCTFFFSFFVFSLLFTFWFSLGLSV